MSDGSDELVAAGYWWEVADAPILHRALTLADLEHVLELVRIDAIAPAAASALARELLTLLDCPAEEVGYCADHGEMYSSREHYLAGRIGDDAGWLHVGRTRREAMRIAFRIVVRTQVLDLVEAACDLATALLEQGAANRYTVMPDYTYLQPAEPTTFGHYLGSFVDPVLRDAERLRAEYARVNASPMGAGAASGSALLWDRSVAGHELGFDGPIEHVRDAMWQHDVVTHALLVATTLIVGQDKLAEDLEILTSGEFSFVRLGGGLVRSSILMPHKRNPYALTVIRGMAGILIGRATGQLALAKSPSARSDLYIFAYGEVPRALDLAVRATRLTAAVVRTVEVDADRMRAALADRSTGSARLAIHLTQEFGLDYRTAHSIVARALDSARRDGRAPNGSDLTKAAEGVHASRIILDDAVVSALTDPDGHVASHRGLGGSADEPVGDFIRRRREVSSELLDWAQRARERAREGEDDVVRRAVRLVDNG